MKRYEKFKTAFRKIWNDPVWSKVISVSIVAAGGLIWAKITDHTWNDIYLSPLSLLSSTRYRNKSSANEALI
jgi:hypothetical protein